MIMSMAGEPTRRVKKRQERGICRNCKFCLGNCSWLSEKDSGNCRKLWNCRLWRAIGEFWMSYACRQDRIYRSAASVFYFYKILNTFIWREI